jgi:DNA-binding CsgD family transcriptional regulator
VSADPSIELVDLAQAYTFLLSNPDADLAQFAVALNSDVDEARSVIDQLASAALVEQQDGELVAVSPLLAMHRLISREHQHLEQRQATLRHSVDALSEILPQYWDVNIAASASSFTEDLPDLPTARRRLAELAAGAQVEVLSFAVARSLNSACAVGDSLDLAVLGRGVRLRTIYPELMADDAGIREYAAELKKHGGDVRVSASVPLCMIIVDRVTAVVPHDPDHPARGCLVITHAGTVSAMVALFHAQWGAAREIDTDGDVSALERMVLQQLAMGAKDETTARHLGMSVRTIRRCVADLMARVGATSRFELGITAARRNWI